MIQFDDIIFFRWVVKNHQSQFSHITFPTETACNLVPYYEASHQRLGALEEESGTLATDSRLKEDLRPRGSWEMVALAAGEGFGLGLG